MNNSLLFLPNLLLRACRPIPFAKHIIPMLMAAFLLSPSLLIARTGKRLKHAYRNSFDVGVGLNLRNVTVKGQRDLIVANFSTATAENAMKPASVQPREGVFTWEAADSIANFCRRNGLKMRGHCLCWHNQFADWMFVDSMGNPVSKEVFYERLRTHIHAVVNRYKDVVYAWDVVNEAIADGPDTISCPYRITPHYRLCGDEFIVRAFEYAHEADPKALLFYNDYSTVDPAKRDRIVNMLRKLRQQGAPIHGLGMQAHYNIYWPDRTLLETAIEAFSRVVDVIHVTEMDVRASHEHGGQLTFSQGTSLVPDSVTLSRFDRQYRMLFEVFRRHSNLIRNVTFWNLSDNDSWIGAANYPLLFDKEYRPKPTYFSVRDLGRSR